MSLIKSIEETYRLKKEKGWDKLYFAIDLHGTIIKPGRLIHLLVYPEAKRGLIYLSSCKNICLILYTSTQLDLLKEFYIWCRENEVTFSYLNENPECLTNDHNGDYTKKFYYSLLLDDRAGFDKDTDWDILIETIKRLE